MNLQPEQLQELQTFLQDTCHAEIESLTRVHHKNKNCNTQKHTLIDGLEVCSKCKSGNFIKTARQTRSADEGMTMIEICNYCGFKKK